MHGALLCTWPSLRFGRPQEGIDFLTCGEQRGRSGGGWRVGGGGGRDEVLVVHTTQHYSPLLLLNEKLARAMRVSTNYYNVTPDGPTSRG